MPGSRTWGGASTFGFAVLWASNWLAFKNITLQRLQAKKGDPFLTWIAAALSRAAKGL
jgi:hypothetical protein